MLNEVFSQFYKEPFPARVSYAVAQLQRHISRGGVIAVK